MKNLILSSSLLLLAFGCATAQEYQYVPFPTANAQWNVDYLSMDCPPSPALCEQGTFAIAGDTLIDGIRYININSVYLGEITNNTFFRFREDTVQRKVFGLWNGQEHLVYDFSLAVGDTFLVPQPLSSGGGVEESYIITSIDTIPIGNSLRKRFTFQGGSAWPESSYWIEGIGGGAGPFMSHYVFESWSVLRCFSDNDELIYSSPFPYPPQYLLQQYPWYEYCDTSVVGIDERNSETVHIYPNPASSLVRLDVSGTQAQIDRLEAFSALGNAMSITRIDPHSINISDWPSGLYIIRISFSNGTFINTKFLKQ